MTNNYSTLKNKNATEKFYLVRINPCRSIVDDLVLVSGFKYTITLPFDVVTELLVNGVVYNKVTTVSGAGEYSYDESTKALVVELPQALVNYQTTGNIVVGYYLFFTNGIHRYAPELPDNSLTTLRLYESRLMSTPELSITQEDIIDRVFTIGNTSIQLINLDYGLNNYLTDNDSFYRRNVEIWRCLDDKDNVAKLYFGVCSGITIGENITISIDNNLSICTDNFYSNNNASDSSFYIDTFPNLDPDSSGTPIYKLYAERSPTVSRNDDELFLVQQSLHWGSNISDGFNLVNISYDDTRNGFTNRVWAACFSSNISSDLTEAISGVFYISDYNYRVTVADKSKYRAGDQLEFFNGSWSQVYAVIQIDHNSVDNYIHIGGDGSVVNIGDLIRRKAISQITIVYKEHAYNLMINRDYTVSILNGIYIVTFVNDFENIFVGYDLRTDCIDPKSKTMYYRVNNHDNCNHGSVLKSMLNKVGISCDSTSFTNANATLFKANFSVPMFKETSFVPLVEIIQSFLSSTFGYLTIDNDFLIRYYLLNAPSTPLVITDNEIIEGSISQDVKYTDIINSINFENVNGENLKPNNNPTYDLNTTREDLVIDNRSAYLYGSNRSITIKYIMQYLSNSKQNILNVLKNRRYSIEFTTKGINFESILGDDITVESDSLIGGVSSRNYKILSIVQNAESTTIRAVDLLGL